LLEKADRLLSGFGAIALLADRAFPCDELIAWFCGRTGWSYVMRLRGDTEIHGTAAPLGCQVRRLNLHCGECRGFRGVRLWADGTQTVNLVIAHPTGLPVEEPWCLISNLDPGLDLVWSYMPSASVVSSYSAIRNLVSSSSRAVACGNWSGSIGCCWWSPSLSWRAVSRVMSS
jgi:hypothetical protein